MHDRSSLAVRQPLVRGELRTLSTEARDGAVPGRAIQVSVENASRFPEIAHLPDAEEEILHHLLRGFAGTQQAFRERDEIVAVGAEHCLECASVSSNPRLLSEGA